MKIIGLNMENAGLANALFSEAVEAKEVLYKLFRDEKHFFDFFGVSNNEQIHKVSFLEKDGRAFASGCYVDGEERAYITFVTVKREARRKGIGTKMLSQLEKKLMQNAGVKRVEIIFFNPMVFSWNVPGTDGADHPNAPGVDSMSQACLFFKNCGYRDYAAQNSYYIDLSKYMLPSSMAEREEELKKEHIIFEYYQAGKHYGMDDLLKKLENSMWEKEISEEIKKENHARPIIIVSHEGKVIGFTGPLDVEPSKRGYFAGIGVDSDYRGKGIAKVLFCKLCVGLRDKDAKFMTLFTGENNPARNIYEAAGFKIVRTWMDMRKE